MRQGRGRRPVRNTRRKRRAGRRYNKAVRVLTVVTAVLLALANVAAFALSDILGSIDYLSEKDMALSDDIASVTLDDADAVSGGDTIDQQQMDDIDREMQQVMVDRDGLRYEKGVTNILVIGTDGWYRNSKKARSDVIIILSINDNTKQIVMTSVMRDTYVAIPGREGSDKINAAHAYGGIALAKETVESAFGIRIDHVVEVNYYTFLDIVDAVGGVDIKHVRKAEVLQINKTVAYVNMCFGYNHSFEILYGGGDDVHLNAAQALGYVRIRIVGNGDYERTDRQREVLNALIDKVRSSDFRTTTRLMTAAAKNVTTDYTEGELAQLALRASEYKDYEIVSQRIPFADTYWGGIYKGVWILKIDFDRNREMLYETVFGDKNAAADNGG